MKNVRDERDERACLYIVVPCYNEEAVLPVTAELFLHKLCGLIASGRITEDSRILFVDDGSQDRTWEILCGLAERDVHFEGISLSRNCGHQKALLAGLMEAQERCDITISIDCDGQDDVDAMDAMVDRWSEGCEVVYGVRSRRDTDTGFKRFTAETFYKCLRGMGAEVVFNHADYRLLSSRVLRELKNFREVNLFLRGMIPLAGFRSAVVYYERQERVAGESHYPLRKMLELAVEGLTSLSVRPLRLITLLGFATACISFLGILWVLTGHLLGRNVVGWTSAVCILCFLGGIQLLCLGVLGEYIGKIYLEVKARPRYIVAERTFSE